MTLAKRIQSILCSVTFLLAMGATDASTQVVFNKKLSPPLLADEDITTARLSPDGNWMVYLTKQTLSKTITLNSVPAAGGAAFKFTETIDLEIQGQTQPIFQISPDSQWIIYILNPGPSDTIDIYRAPIAGGTPQLLCPSLPFENKMRWFMISPDSKWIMYYIYHGESGFFDVFSVPISGGAPIQINKNIGVLWPEITRDSTKIIYAEISYPNIDTYSVPISGGDATKLNGDLWGSSDFDLSADGSRVVFQSHQSESESRNLFSVGSSGGTPVMLNLPFDFIGYVMNWRIDKNSKYVLFGTREILFADPVEMSKYFAVPIEGGTPTRLDNFNVDPSTYDIMDYGPSHDGLSALFAQRSKDSYNSAAGIYSVPLTGGTPTRLDPPNIIGVDEELGWWYDLLPGNKNLLLTTTPIGKFNPKNIYRVSLPEGTSIKLSHDLASNEFLRMALEPNPQRIFYTTVMDDSFDWQKTTGLYTVTLDGGNAIQVNGELVEGGHVGVLTASPDNRTIYYLADQDTDEVWELYSSTLSCSSEQPHSTDANHDYEISFSELLRAIQFYNLDAISCMDGTEDGYIPGDNGTHTCSAYSADYNPQNWVVEFSELLRLIQLYHTGYYYACPGVGEDGFCICEL